MKYLIIIICLIPTLLLGAPSMSFYGDIQRWWVGTVEEGSGQSDPEMLGRCRVRIDGIHGSDISLDDLPYAQTLLPSTSGGTSGNVETPQLLAGAKVMGFFLDGMTSQLPVVWGYLPHIGIPSITQQEIAAKEVRVINQTHSTRDIISTATNLQNPQLSTENITIAWNFFSGPLTNRQYKNHHIAAIIGNFMHESGADTTIDPTAISGITNENSQGIAQWNPAKAAGARLASLSNFAAERNRPHTDLLTQLAFTDHELHTIGYLRATFFETKTVEQATMQFMRYYLRPAAINKTTTFFPSKDGGRFPAQTDKARLGEAKRLANANKIYIKFTQG